MTNNNLQQNRKMLNVITAAILTPVIALVLLVSFMQFTTTLTSAQTDFRQAAEDTLKNGIFVAAFSGNALIPAYSDMLQTPSVSLTDVINVVAAALEREQLTNLAAVVQTTSTTVDSQVQNGNMTYSITMPISTFIDCGVESAERLAVYTVEHAETEPIYILKSLEFTVSPNPSNLADELVTIKLPSAVTVLIFDSKNDGDREETTAEWETTASQIITTQVKTTLATTASLPIIPTQQVTTKSQGSTTASVDKAVGDDNGSSTIVHEIATESTSVCEPEYEQGTELEESTDEPEDDLSIKESEEDSSPKTGELSFRGRLDID